MSRTPSSALVALLILLPASAALAAELASPEPNVCARSTRIVLAEATSAETVWSPDGLLHTHTWFSVVVPFKGPSAPDTFALDILGGEADGVTLIAADHPTFAVDDTYLLHLVDGPDGHPMLTTLRSVVHIPGQVDAATITALSTRVHEVCDAQ